MLINTIVNFNSLFASWLFLSGILCLRVRHCISDRLFNGRGRWRHIIQLQNDGKFVGKRSDQVVGLVELLQAYKLLGGHRTFMIIRCLG